MRVDKKSENYKRAKQRVEELRGFYTHLVVYLTVNLILFLINLVSSPQSFWFYWVTLFWGIGILFHGLGVFVLEGKLLGREWEERKIKEIMGKEKK